MCHWLLVFFQLSGKFPKDRLKFNRHFMGTHNTVKTINRRRHGQSIGHGSKLAFTEAWQETIRCRMMFKRAASITHLVIPPFVSWILIEPNFYRSSSIHVRTPSPFRHISLHSKTGRNSARSSPLFRCIYVWEGFVWLISISGRERSPCEAALVVKQTWSRERGALSSPLRQRTTTLPASSTPSE